MKIIFLFGSSQRVLPYFASHATCCQIGYGFQGFLSRTGLIGNSYLPLTEALTHLTHSQFIWLVHLYMIIFSLNFLITIFVFFVHSAASPRRKAQYYVYCKTCKSVTPGKLRVRCSVCKEGAIVLQQVATQLFKSVFRNKDLLNLHFKIEILQVSSTLYTFTYCVKKLFYYYYNCYYFFYYNYYNYYYYYYYYYYDHHHYLIVTYSMAFKLF